MRFKELSKVKTNSSCLGGRQYGTTKAKEDDKFPDGRILFSGKNVKCNIKKSRTVDDKTIKMEGLRNLLENTKTFG